jgi:hypothetical protein
LKKGETEMGANDQSLAGRQVNSVTPHIEDFALAAADNGTRHTNTGAAGAVKCSLPAAVPGLHFGFSVGAAQQLQLDPNGTETISQPSNGVPGAAGKYLWADAVGETVYLECFVAGNWCAIGTGAWTAEA